MPCIVIVRRLFYDIQTFFSVNDDTNEVKTS